MSRPKRVFPADIEWILNNLDVEDAKPPSKVVKAMWEHVRKPEHREKFLSKVMVMRYSKLNQEMEQEEKRRVEGMGVVDELIIKLIDNYEKLKAEGVDIDELEMKGMEN